MSSSRSTLSRVAESGRSGSKWRAEAPGRARPSGESVPGPWGRLYAYSGERVRHPTNCARQRRVRGLEGSDCLTQLLDDRLGLRAPLLLALEQVLDVAEHAAQQLARPIVDRVGALELGVELFEHLAQVLLPHAGHATRSGAYGSRWFHRRSPVRRAHA